MVRETRHLWVGNLPDNIREDRIREHFKRYGRVQNVKLLGRTDNANSSLGGNGNSGVCATVAFMDIKSASKAHNAEHVLDERTLTTEYYEPAAIPSAAGAPSAGSSPAGSGYSGSSSSVNSAPTPASVSRYHISGGEDNASNTCPLAASAAAPANWRGTNDSATEYCRRGNTPSAYSNRYQRNNSTAPYSTPPSNVERTPTITHQRWYVSGERAAGTTGGESTPSTPGGCTEGGRRRRLSGSGSSRSDSSSPEPSDTSRASTPATQPPLSHHANHRTPPTVQHQWASTASGRPLAICVRNLPTRSTDSSLKDGLYHEYKKHGKVVWVKVVGQNADRYAVVRFKKPSDVEKALEVSQDKFFFGCKISVAPHQSCEEDADSTKPYETDIDEYHPKATRTLFIGNLEKDVTQQQLRDKFKHFGRIIEIDIKKGSGGGAGYAFCQYASISSVVEAIRAMDGEYVGGSRVKLGFGKPVATTCVWVDGLTEHTEKQVLGAVSRCGAATSVCVDRAAGAALVHFEQAAAAGAAVRELRRVAAAASAAEPDHPRLCVDYASRECQEAFYEQLEKHGGSAALTGSERLTADLTSRYLPPRHESLRYDGCGSRSRASSYGRGSSRTPRYSSLEHYDPTEYAADRRYRVYDDPGSSPQNEEAPYEDRLQSVVVSPHRARRHRRDSSPEDRKHSKERHRSGVRRSRSGSRGGDRHSARRRHRRRHDGSSSRAGTPLRDEPDALPAEPRRPPRERPPLPMSLPLPKFAAQLLRTAPPTPRLHPPPAFAPDSPPRPPSVSSSSGGSAPHSPSLEERIRSLDEKYEKWSGTRALAEPPDRTRLRHRLLDIDINEVKPSEVVRSLLAKRSVFDEDSERLEGAVRPTSPTGSVRSRSVCTARRYTFAPLSQIHPLLSQDGDPEGDAEGEMAERPADPRLNRPERPPRIERLGKFNESDYRLDERPGPHTPPTPCTIMDVPITLTPVTIPKEENCNSQSKPSTFNNDNLIRFKLGVDYDSIVNKEKTSTELTSQRNEFDSISKSSDLETINKLEGKPIVIDTIETDTRFVMDMLLKRIESSHELKPTDIITNELNSPLITNINETVIHTKTLDVDNLGNSVKEDVSSITQINIEDNTSKQAEKDSTQVITQTSHLNDLCSMKIHNELSDTCKDLMKACEKNGKDKCGYNILEVFHISKFEKENIQFEKPIEKESVNNSKTHLSLEKKSDTNKNTEDRSKYDREKLRHSTKDVLENNVITNEKEKSKNIRHEKCYEKDKKQRDEIEKSNNYTSDKVKVDKLKDKVERDDKNKTFEDKPPRESHQKKEKVEKRKDSFDGDVSRSKKEEKHKYDRCKKDSEIKREVKKESDSHKTRKPSKDESSREVARKDSTDSSTSRASHESSKTKELDCIDIKDEFKIKSRQSDGLIKHGADKDFFLKAIEPKLEPISDCLVTIKKEIKEEINLENLCKNKVENFLEHTYKLKDVSDKPRHYSLDSPSLESKRKERLNSCSSLPSTIGHKRRMSSQDIDCLNDDTKKSKVDNKFPERRESKDSRVIDKHKSTKFSKGHFAKLIESKTKDDKKNQVKPPDQTSIDIKESEIKDQKHTDNAKTLKKSPKDEVERHKSGLQLDGLHNDLDFLATLELRSSEEDERQKALRKEMKEKKRIQQLQQIQELQMQQDAMQQAELIVKVKDDKKLKTDDKKKEVARDKRMSTDRKSRDEKQDSSKRKNRKNIHTSDSSDSDEPKKHSIFDIVDDEPTYISMYDKVKARSCKNMQKQEEEKRQEKIKAKFSQLKQSRAKREEKKRSSWDEDSDSDQDRKNTKKSSMENSSDDENILSQCKKQDKSSMSYPDYDPNKSDDYYTIMCNDVDMRNKINSRKNSRTRIMSDTSDEEPAKRNIIKSPNNYFKDIKKELNSSDFLDDNKSENAHFKDTDYHMIKRKSLFNLFGKSDSDDTKVKSCFITENDCKSSFVKSISNEFSSESESMLPTRNLDDMRKKHKKKVKKHKFAYSDDEIRKDLENSDTSALETENKHKLIEKQRRHSSKKEKRRDKIRESTDVDESREERNKKKDQNVSVFNHFDFNVETLSNNVKKDGKMEDIFGPLSDDSDKDCRGFQNKTEFSEIRYEKNYSSKNDLCKSSELKLREKEDIKRKKDKRRKEKRMSKDDDNSLDVDAVSKAIEARLFADADDDTNVKISSIGECLNKVVSTSHKHNQDNFTSNEYNKHERSKKEFKEKKKKKKRNKEDRQFRKVHHFYNQSTSEKQNISNVNEKHGPESSLKTMFLDIPLPKENPITETKTKIEDNIIHLESPSLPRLTDSPPIARKMDENIKSQDHCQTPTENTLEIKTDDINKEVFLEISVDSDFQCTSNNTTEESFHESFRTTSDSDKQKSDALLLPYEKDSSENISVTIPDYESDETKMVEKKTDKIEVQTCKIEKKIEEKPRAIISQEETEDAVAALLGESFGGKEDTFSGYDEVENNSTNQNEIEHAAIENNNIPEEDAEEMRQAVQNLNACEMEIKPETPVSDNDLLLIDTDTEEPDEAGHDAIERLPVNIIATSQSLTNNTENIKSSDVSNVIVSKLKQNVSPSMESEVSDCSTIRDSDVKIHLTKRENVQIISSTATPLITSWALTNNKSLDSHTMNTNTMVNTNAITKRDLIDTKSSHITANIVQIRTPSVQNIHVNNMPRAVAAPTRASTPFQVIGPPLRSRTALPQSTPPTIKIPEPHILYQRPQGIVISPRITNEPTLLSPKVSPRAESTGSPRLANMTILSGPPQSLSGASPRAGGQVTVVRVPQLPTLGVGGINSAGAVRALLSPPRPGSVLVSTPSPHFGRLPVTPVLAPISKQVTVSNVANVVTCNKNTCPVSPQTHHQKITTLGDCGKLEHRTDAVSDNSKIILSPTSLQRSGNPALVTQNRLIMQNAVHVSNVGPALHINNKVLINAVNHLNEKRDCQKQEQINHIPFGPAPLIHVAGVNHSSASLIQGSPKSVVCSVQDTNTINRCKDGPNVIHTFSSQRLIPSSSISNLLQIDSNKAPAPVLSIRSPVLTKVEGPVTSTSFSTISPLLIKTTNTAGSLRLNTKVDTNYIDAGKCMPVQILQDKEFKFSENRDERISISNSNAVKINEMNLSLDSTSPKMEQIAKCETDFEELLKDNTNEIKVTNDPEKKLEVNVGKTVTLITSNNSPRHDKINNISIKENFSHISSDVKYSEHSYSQAHNVNFNKNQIDEQNNLQKSILTDGIAQTLLDENIGSENKLKKDKNDSSMMFNEKNNTENKLPILEDEKSSKLVTDTKSENECSQNHLINIHENDLWSAKDVNIESVIKKVDSLCNDMTDTHNQSDSVCESVKNHASETDPGDLSIGSANNKTSDDTNISTTNCSVIKETVLDINPPVPKRGGRNCRGKKNEKNKDKVQTRQISKPVRGGTAAKRGRGRTKLDKKLKGFVNNNTSTIPGDIYDFHDDSGDEVASSPAKNEARPRLILTIKSPISGHSNVTATSSLTISQKDQNKIIEKGNKEEKNEDFSSPCVNTRKSRRLQEKDVQRSTVDDVIEDVVKGANVQSKSSKESVKKRSTRQTGVKVNNNFERLPSTETRKSPRGVKRPRDTSLSDASVESGDEKGGKCEEVSGDAKIARPADAITPIPIAPSTNPAPIPPTATAVAHPVPTPIIKPPKKMISEISAKLGCSFEASTGEGVTQSQTERSLIDAGDRRDGEKKLAMSGAGSNDCGGVGEVGTSRRPPDGVPGPPLVVGAAEPGDARVQSPALPHRPPSMPTTHRPADRATPILGREGAGEAEVGVGVGAGVAGNVVRGWRGAYAATASLPRGAHHPQQPQSSYHPHHPAHPTHPTHPTLPPHPLEPHTHQVKHVAVVPPSQHPHHPGTASRVSVPTISPQGQQIPPGEGAYPHFSHQHYQMYQQHFRATQHESRTTPSPYTRSLEAEGCEAPTPPLELRRPPSARVPRPAHSPAHSPSPVDRHIMYAVRCGRSPPPAHGTSRLPGALPPSAAPGPPHASQVPREADSLQMLLRRYPVMWQGLLALKNDSAAVQMHFVGGNPRVAGDTLSRHSDGSTPLLRIAQRMRLEQAQLDQVHRKMKVEQEHCTLLALPCGRDHMDVLQQSTNLSAGFITYLQRKQAAGIVNIAPPGHHQAMFTVHIFPSCDFANENLNRIAPDLMHRVADIAHLLIVIATV